MHRLTLLTLLTLSLAPLALADGTAELDGVWVPFHDGLFGGRSQHTSFTSSDCAAPGAAMDDAAGTLGFDPASATTLSGCGQIDARVSEYAGVASHLAGNRVDALSSGALVFWAESETPVTVCVESSVTHTFACSTAVEANGWTVVPVSMLEWEGSARMDPRQSVSFVSFTATQTERVVLTVASLALVPWSPQSPEGLSDDQVVEACGCVASSSSFGWLWLVGLAPLVWRRRS